MLPPLYTMNPSHCAVRKAGTVHSLSGVQGIQSSVPLIPNFGSGGFETIIIDGEERVVPVLVERKPSIPDSLKNATPSEPSLISKFRPYARAIATGVEYSRSKKIPNALVAGLVPYIYFAYVVYDEYKKRK